MWNRSVVMLMVGAACLAIDATAAVAQDTTTRTTTSSRRIPLRKESSGEVVSRIDTVTVYQTDTLSVPATVRVDTVTVTNTNTVTQVDTVTLTPMVPRRIGGLYFGLAAGAAMPYGSLRTANQTGPVGQVQVGWQGLNNPLGIRGDVNYTHYGMDATYGFLGARPNLWNANLDATLHLPFFNHTLGSSILMTPYVIGGGSYVSFNNLRMRLDADGGVFGGVATNDVVIAGNGNNYTFVPNGDTGYHSNWGWNAGAGLDFHAGRKDVFVEARGVRFDHGSDYSGAAWHWPIVFGLNFY